MKESSIAEFKPPTGTAIRNRSCNVDPLFPFRGRQLMHLFADVLPIFPENKNRTNKVK